MPIGTKINVALKSDNFESLSDALKGQTLRRTDFEQVIDEARCGDFVFADPPYTVKHDNNGFVKYKEKIFSWKDQVRLKESLDRAARKGALIMVSNANHPSIEDLYSTYLILTKLERNSVISGATKGRSTATELIIRNYTNA